MEQVDLKAMRIKYAPISSRKCVVCGGTMSEMSSNHGLLVLGCNAPRNIDTDAFEAKHFQKSLFTVTAAVPVGDPSVLALCDELEALRAKVAAAPEVLREWPAKMEDALGEWLLCLHGARAPRGEFEANGNRKPLFRDEEGDIWPAHEFEPGEFFVRAP